MNRQYEIVFIGLSLSSSWGNGHATTFRALLRGLHELGHRVLFLERDVPWYARNRDLPDPDFCTLLYYDTVEELVSRHARYLKSAEAVVVGSYVPDGVAVIDAVHQLEPRLLCFYDIDTPVTLAKLSAGDEEYLASRQIPDFDIYFSFSGGPVLATLEDGFGAPRAEALFCSVDTDRYYNTGEPLTWDLGYLGTYSPDRQPALERLLIEPARRLPDMKFVVAGPQYPGDIDWPPNVDRIDHLAPSGHASFYSRQRFTLNVTRADMRSTGWSPSVRLFEAAACRTPVISDRWEGLEDLFPGAVLLCDDTGDIVRALRDVSDAERKGLADAAHSIVMRDHTGLARAGELSRALMIDQVGSAAEISKIMSA
jgi:spore maturation protein CgeB